MLKWILGTLVGVVAGLAIYFSLYLGAFKPVALHEAPIGNLRVLALEHIGPYHKIAPDIEKVEAWAKANGIECQKTFGQYFDDPRQVEEGRLRSRGGCIWGSDVQSAYPEQKLPTLPQGFEMSEIPATQALIAVFEGSPAIGPSKVYSKAEEYFSQVPYKRGSSVVEVYEIHSQKAMTTTYFFPFTK
jgi:hypothetical protein